MSKYCLTVKHLSSSRAAVIPLRPRTCRLRLLVESDVVDRCNAHATASPSAAAELLPFPRRLPRDGFGDETNCTSFKTPVGSPVAGSRTITPSAAPVFPGIPLRV